MNLANMNLISLTSTSSAPVHFGNSVTVLYIYTVKL